MTSVAGVAGAFYDEDFEKDYQRFQSNVGSTGVIGNASGNGQQASPFVRTEEGGPFSGDKNGSSLAVADEFNANIQMLDHHIDVEEMSSQGKKHSAKDKSRVLSDRSMKAGNSNRKPSKSQG